MHDKARGKINVKANAPQLWFRYWYEDADVELRNWAVHGAEASIADAQSEED